MPRPYRRNADGVTLVLRVTPNAGADRIEGAETRDDGTCVLRMRVKAVPDKGKANAAVIALVAKSLKMPKSAFTLTSGETARQKTLEIEGDPDELSARLDGLLES